MAYVENKRKELKTKYLADTPEVGKEMGLRAVKSHITMKDRVGIG